MALDLSFDPGMPSPLNISDEHNISNIISMLESPQADSECLLDSEPRSKILEGVVAYVEVRSKNENRSSAVCHELQQLGARVVDKLGPDVTHVIWKEGRPSTRDRARKRGIPVVSVLWVASCKKNEERVPESLFEVDTSQDNTPVLIGKLKKSKSMQPNDFESEVANSADRGQKKRKRQCNADRFKMLKTPKPGTTISAPKFYVAETQPRSPLSFCSPNITVPDTPPSMRALMNSLKAKESKEKKDSEASSVGKENGSGMFSPLTAKAGQEPIQKRLFASPEREQSPRLPVPEVTNGKSSKPGNKVQSVSSKPEAATRSAETLSDNNTKKASKKRKLLALNEDPSPELMQPTISSNAAQTKMSILSCGPKKGGMLKKVSYKSDSGEQPSKRRRVNCTDDNETDISKDKILKTLKQASSIKVRSDVTKQKSVSFKSRCSSPETSAENSVLTSQDTTDSSINSTVVNRNRRKSVAVCKATTAEQPPVRKSQRRSVGGNFSKPSAISQSIPETEIESRTIETSQKKGNNSSENTTASGSKKDAQKGVISNLLQVDTNSSKTNRRRSVRLGSLSNSQPTVSSQITTPVLHQQSRSCMEASTANANSANTSLQHDGNSERKSRNSNDGLQRNRAGSQQSNDLSQLSMSSSDGEGRKKRLDKRKWIKQVIEENSNNLSQEDMPTLVMTSLHFDEQEIVLSVAKKLGGFRVVENMSERTTHAVCGNNRRTLNVLQAIARGCWLLSLEWVYKSLEAGKWIEEEPYEQRDFFPAIQVSRSKRQRGCSNELFKDLGSIYVSEQCAPPKHHLEQLITLCGGQVATIVRRASLCVGTVMKPDVTTVSEQWILDCLTAFEVLPQQEYLLRSPRQLREPSPDY